MAANGNYNKPGAMETSGATPVQEYTEKRGAISGFFYWVLSWALPGIGMFCESYFVFSLGNITPILQTTYADCWKTYKMCDTNWVQNISTIQVALIICGMLSLGYLADQIGRKWGSVTTASFMFVGGVLMCAADGPNITGLAIMFTIAQALFGYGVGGEYPLASSSAAERSEASRELRYRRGEMVVCTFAMQGWGNLINVIVLCILLAAFGQTGVNVAANPKKHIKAVHQLTNWKLDYVWRLSFGIGLIPVTFMLLYRIFFLQESKVWHRVHKSREVAMAEQGNLYHFYWHRLVGAAGAWFLWDVSFYGNKLFQSSFIKVIAGPNASILLTLEWTLLNSFVALIGYYFSAFTIDKKWMGRVRLQIFGFSWVFVIFLCCAAAYHDLSKPKNIAWFQALYFLSSFFGQFGPNATTWLLPGEIFPTEVRATCHGICAATGKCGALLAGILFPLTAVRTRFYICAFFNLGGAVLTYLFIPNMMSMDLREGDRRWAAIMAGNPKGYTGDAVKPDNLSTYERMIGAGKVYDPNADAVAQKSEAKDQPMTV